MLKRGLRIVALGGVSTFALTACGSGGQAIPVKSAGDQMSFGVAMAQRGLWSEAQFRFERASRSSRDVGVLNNLAVASEALGQFDEALKYYQEALALAPSDPDVRNNYNRFVSFYESFRVTEEGQETEAEDQETAPPGTATGAAAEDDTAEPNQGGMPR
jgi:tetratricopeptide (TPR) repeat protein